MMVLLTKNSLVVKTVRVNTICSLLFGSFCVHHCIPGAIHLAMMIGTLLCMKYYKFKYPETAQVWLLFLPYFLF